MSGQPAKVVLKLRKWPSEETVSSFNSALDVVSLALRMSKSAVMLNISRDISMDVFRDAFNGIFWDITKNIYI